MIIGQIPLYGDDNVLTKLFDIRGEGGEINNPLSSKDVSDTDFGNRMRNNSTDNSSQG